ncbi:hypothetical protein CHLRE_14g614708v5 [Chlamydomonas reinhardtii]|uniref:Uncharacterized protein n=1 Tax=Chlamydomonas reinhardtii TaxID=3055 RepID=A0A2K3CXH5_CHLRE|nr:uncharacterized protein CHLRE_14g614708v5 [Chlamydomonas reinhardtii]PNW72994.1 hypothetical protein CHLRE_14g614708v5 [Chlamydomonas reinhardtii]
MANDDIRHELQEFKLQVAEQQRAQEQRWGQEMAALKRALYVITKEDVAQLLRLALSVIGYGQRSSSPAHEKLA